MAKLRPDLFKTVDRVETRFIAIRDTLTRPSAVSEMDAIGIDAAHCKQGRLGIGYHFLILSNGVVQLCRPVNTCGSHSRDMDANSVAIGIVGGLNSLGERRDTRTDAQLEALGHLVDFLKKLYPDADVHDKQ